MVVSIVLVTLFAAGPAPAAPSSSGLKDPFATREGEGSDLKDPWAGEPRGGQLGLKNPFLARDPAARETPVSELRDPFTAASSAIGRMPELKDPWARPQADHAPAPVRSDLLDPFSTPRDSLRDPWAARRSATSG